MTPRFRTLRLNEQEECLQLWTRIFTPGEDYFVRYFLDPLWKPDYTRVCELDGRLIATVQIVRRAVRLNGHTVWMAGIANVATLPDYRGRGLASQLMRDAHTVIDSEDFTFALLFTGIHDFYARLGWEPLTVQVPVAPPGPAALNDRWRFRAAEPHDLPLVQRWHERTYADHPFTVVRDETYWRVWLRWDDPNWRRGFYIAEYDGEPRGYLGIETHHCQLDDGSTRVEALSLIEMGMEQADDESVDALVGFVNAVALQAGADYVRWCVPVRDSERWLQPRLDRLVRMPVRLPMVRIGKHERLRDAFERLGAPPPAELESLSGAQALRLLFGLYDDSDLPDLPRTLTTRYPPRPAIYLPTDSF